MRIYPFRAWRPRPDLAARVAAVPYDVVDTAEAAALAAANPYSYLHVSRAEIDLPAGADPYADSTYARAAETLRTFQAQGVLLREPQPALYLYRLTMAGRSQTGMAACCATEDYESGALKTHEKTRPDKENDRTRHIERLKAHAEPIFIAYRDDTALADLMADATRREPLYDFRAPDGIGHTVWRIAEPEPFVRAFARIPTAYIADGHHRAAAAVRVAQARRRADPAPLAAPEYNRFLGVLFPASQLRILPYNRCVRDLNGLSAEQFLAALRARFAVLPDAAPEPPAPAHVSLYLDRRWYGISWPAEERADSVARLDVSVLQDRLLAPVLGIRDPRTDPRIEFIGGIRGADELERRVASGRAAVAFSLYPTQVAQIMAIADAGQIMPPKSTWFEPKLRSGLLVHTLE
jgi:uncharacterized protein (DUF1015 family)